MGLSANLRLGLLPAIFAAVGIITPSQASQPTDVAAITRTIEADVAQIVAGLNAHDATRTTAFDAVDIVSMECGSAPVVGIDADRDGFASGFAHDPHWRVSLINESVDLSSSGDFAVYRGAYNEENSRAGVVTTHRTNFIAEFRRRDDGEWRMHWYMVANMEPSHPM